MTNTSTVEAIQNQQVTMVQLLTAICELRELARESRDLLKAILEKDGKTK